MNDKEAHGLGVQGEDEGAEPSIAVSSPLDLQIVELTDVGRLRPHNEDYVEHYVPSDLQERERKGILLLVADGMGGHQAGEVASKKAVEEVIAQYYADSGHDAGTSLVRAFRAANQKVYGQAQADPSKAGMGTTLVAAVILGRKVFVANVGDSRAYLINQKGIGQITEDHSWVEEQVRAGLLNVEQASHHPQRNLLTRALGSKPAVDVDLFEGELGDTDSLLLCTDGLTGRVEDAEIAIAVQQYPPEEAARSLVALANERGGNDNITVLLATSRREAATGAGSMPQKYGKRESRPLPLVPILGVAVGLLVLALIGLLAAPLLTGKNPTATPTPTASPSSPTASLAGTTAPGLDAEATLTSDTSSPTDTTGAAVDPTATLRPIPAQTPGATSLVPANTPAAAPTNPPLTGTAPVLLAPEEGLSASGVVTFAWSYEPLPATSVFQLLIGPGAEAIPDEPVQTTRELSLPIDLVQVSQLAEGGPGQYSWTVVVVDAATGTETGPKAVARHFFYAGPQTTPAP